MKIVLSKQINGSFSFANISYNQNNFPENLDYGDVYFSDAGGIAETRHVFIDGNNLEDRLSTTNNKEFVILETGFGTGSNLITLMDFYNKLEQQKTNISFLSFELNPLTIEDLKNSHQNSLLPNEANKLIKAFEETNLNIGLNIIKIDEHFTLYLFIGDIIECLQSIDTSLTDKIDAVFLDGFAPKLNPRMWSFELFSNLKPLLKNDATLATFTVSRIVRDNLTNANFYIKKRPGFGRKRDMLTAKITPF